MATGSPPPPIDRPPFILSQGMRLLTDVQHPRRYLAPEYFRAGRLADRQSDRSAMPKRDTVENAWIPVDRWDVAFDRVMIKEQQHVSLRRLVFVTDAGVGKTTNLRWTCSVLCGEESDKLAFCLPLADLVPSGAVGSDWDHVVRAKLLSLLRQALGLEAGRLSDDMARALFERLLEAGRIVLCLDALDQMPVHSPALEALKYLLDHPAWDTCRIILSARPYALERHWEDLFDNGKHGWRFVQLDEFNEDQQRQFLGRAPGDDRDRLDMILTVIEQDAKQILSVPRVLEMIRQLPVNDLAGLETASDVYWRAVCHLVDKGLADREARMLGAPVGSRDPARLVDAQQTALKLLAASAFQMVATRVPLEREVEHRVRGREWTNERHRLAVGEHVPNFDRVHTDQFEEFCVKVFKRVKEPLYGNNYPHFQQDLSRLEAMNTFLSHGLLDVGELNQLQFRNRSLQEFLAALWMARHCTDDDSEEIRGWLYRTDDPLSEEYYWVWRFATEMPVAARNGLAWIRAMQPLYAPGDGTKHRVRATEMIDRSWNSMEAYSQRTNSVPENAAGQAHAALVGFQSEFSRMLNWWHIFHGWRGWREWWVATRLMRGFVTLPAGEFVMGSPEGERERRDNEEQRSIEIKESFRMHRYQVTNAQFRLFAPGHERGEHSKGWNCPVADVSWYDARVFVRWLGRGFQLPTEEQWEYACRAGTTTAYCYGDDEERLGEYAWYRKNSGGRAHPVGQKKSNAWGMYDMHGNVWEWCDSWYDESARDRVFRGGCWDFPAWFARSASRVRFVPSSRSDSLGFRLAFSSREQSGPPVGGESGASETEAWRAEGRSPPAGAEVELAGVQGRSPWSR